MVLILRQREASTEALAGKVCYVYANYSLMQFIISTNLVQTTYWLHNKLICLYWSLLQRDFIMLIKKLSPWNVNNGPLKCGKCRRRFPSKYNSTRLRLSIFSFPSPSPFSLLTLYLPSILLPPHSLCLCPHCSTCLHFTFPFFPSFISLTVPLSFLPSPPTFSNALPME